MIDNRTAPYAALLLRVALGVMFLAHGLTKLLVYTLPGTAQFFAKIGFAGWLAYPVTIFEVAAGVLLILGVWRAGSPPSRWCSCSSRRPCISAMAGVRQYGRRLGVPDFPDRGGGRAGAAG